MNKLLFLILLIPSKSYSQTCVVGYLTDSSIIVGADSRTTRYLFEEGMITEFPDSTCKIHNVGKYNFVNINNFADDARDEAVRLCNKSKSFTELVDSFRINFKNKLLSFLSSYKTHTPHLYDSLLKDTAIVQIIFFGYEGNAGGYVWMRFKAKENTNGSLTVYAITEQPNYKIFAAGETTPIDNLLELPKTWSNGIKQGIVNLINIAAKYDSIYIAPPIDIIEVSPKGVKWLDRKDMCGFAN